MNEGFFLQENIKLQIIEYDRNLGFYLENVKIKYQIMKSNLNVIKEIVKIEGNTSAVTRC